MELKFIGRNTQGRTVTNVTVDSEQPFLALYNELISNGTISDYNESWDRAKADKVGLDYDEILDKAIEADLNGDENALDVANEMIEGLPDLNEEEINDLISYETGNAYYQDYFIIINDEEYKVETFHFEDGEVVDDLQDVVYCG